MMSQKDLKLCFQTHKSLRIITATTAKIKYNIQFRIALYVKESLYDVENVSFSFRFDRTTTSKVHKQYDTYAQYCFKNKTLYKTVLVDLCLPVIVNMNISNILNIF